MPTIDTTRRRKDRADRFGEPLPLPWLALAVALLALATPACTMAYAGHGPGYHASAHATYHAPTRTTQTRRTTRHVHHAPPTRVYHGGHWLHYRNDGYYVQHRGGWVRARSVPTHVRRYHSTSSRSRSTHVRRSTSPRRSSVTTERRGSRSLGEGTRQLVGEQRRSVSPR